MRKLGAIAIVLAMTALSANAGVITDFVHLPGPNPDGSRTIEGTDYNVFDMMVDTTTDWTNSTLEIVLTTGSFYNNATYGADVEPNPGFFPLVPDLEWDTCATVPAGHPAMAAFTPNAQFGQNTLDGAIPPGNTHIKAGWFDTSTSGPDGRIARLTMSVGAAGTITGSSYNALPGETNPEKEILEGWSVAGGAIVPEPATMTLLGLGGLALLRRRKK